MKTSVLFLGKKKDRKRTGRKEKGAEGGSMGLTASHTGNISSQTSLLGPKGP